MLLSFLGNNLHACGKYCLMMVLSLPCVLMKTIIKAALIYIFSIGINHSLGAWTLGGAGASIWRTPSLESDDDKRIGSTSEGSVYSRVNSLKK